MSNSFMNSVKNFFGFEEEKEENNITTTPQKTSVHQSKPMIKHNPNKTSRLFEIRIEEPRIYEDSLNIAAQLRENTPVIVNLKYLDTETSKRLIDFICGTAYAINGHMMKIGENIFIFTPAQVQLVNPEAGQSLNENMQKSQDSLLFKSVANA